MANKHVSESRYFLTELNDGIQWLTDGQDFGMHSAAARGLLEALKVLCEDLQTRLDASTEGATVADGLVNGEDANRSWRAWLFDVMSTRGDIAYAAIKAAKEGVTQRRRVDGA